MRAAASTTCSQLSSTSSSRFERERVRDAMRRRRARSEFEPERGGDGDRDEVGIGERRELDDPDPVGKFRQQVSCDLEAEPRLADAAGAGQRDEAMGGAEVQDLVELGVAADQFGNRLRQVRRRRDGAAPLQASARLPAHRASPQVVRISPVNW